MLPSSNAPPHEIGSAPPGARRAAPGRSPAPAIPDGRETGPGGLLQPATLVASRLLMGREDATWTLPEQIAVAIGERILNETIAPGNRIGEEALAREFQVSRGPIRDALKILEAAGLAVITSRRGATASPLGADDLREIFELRQNLLALAIHGFARLSVAADLLQLKQHVLALEMVPAEPHAALLFTDAHDRVMLHLAHHCGNHRIARIMTTLSLQSFRYFRRGRMHGALESMRRSEVIAFYRDLVRTFELEQSVEPMLLRLQQIYADRASNIGLFLS